MCLALAQSVLCWPPCAMQSHGTRAQLLFHLQACRWQPEQDKGRVSAIAHLATYDATPHLFDCPFPGPKPSREGIKLSLGHIVAVATPNYAPCKRYQSIVTALWREPSGSTVFLYYHQTKSVRQLRGKRRHKKHMEHTP